jgi:hypothetical protein
MLRTDSEMTRKISKDRGTLIQLETHRGNATLRNTIEADIIVGRIFARTLFWRDFFHRRQTIAELHQMQTIMLLELLSPKLDRTSALVNI